MSSKKEKNAIAQRVAIIGVMAAMSYLLMFLKFPISFLGFLELELSDIPALIAGIVYGPIIGVLIELVKNLLHLTVTSTGGVGELSNFIVMSSFILPVSIIAKKNRKMPRIITGLVFGVLLMTLFGALSNYFITVPMYLKIMGEDAILNLAQKTIPAITSIEKLILYGIVPFNVVKGTILAVISMIVYVPYAKITKTYNN